jgi:hypothetical protein
VENKNFVENYDENFIKKKKSSNTVTGTKTQQDIIKDLHCIFFFING